MVATNDPAASVLLGGTSVSPCRLVLRMTSSPSSFAAVEPIALRHTARINSHSFFISGPPSRSIDTRYGSVNDDSGPFNRGYVRGPLTAEPACARGIGRCVHWRAAIRSVQDAGRTAAASAMVAQFVAAIE